MPTTPAPIARLLSLGGELAPPSPGQPRRKFDLSHMRTLLDALGSPQQGFASVLIAGTNGKGSTAATLASILQAAGHRTGLYTSPHLERPNERIRIDCDAISDQALAARFEQVEATAAQLVAAGHLPHTPSFFETVTAIAFLHFAAPLGSEQADPHRAAEIAILEVGLGGRLDATNVVDPLLSVITDISLDHQQWLGDTVAAITREKAGILRPRGTLVTLPQHPEANQAIGEAAVPLDVEAISAADFLPSNYLSGVGVGQGRNHYPLSLPPSLLDSSVLQVDSPLVGAHQQRNIALAIAAAIQLHRTRGFPLTADAIERGIRQTAWPGRLQLLHPPAALARFAPVLLDAAHNPAGAWALRAFLSSLPAAQPRTLVFACMADKAIDELAQVLFPVMDSVHLTKTATPRAADPDRLAAAAELTGATHRVFANPSEALEAALAETPWTGLVIVAGSIPLVGECLSRLQSWG